MSLYGRWFSSQAISLALREKVGLKHGVDIVVRRRDGSIKDERHYGDIKDGVKRKIKDSFFARLWKRFISRQCVMSDLITNAGKASVAGLILTDIVEADYDYLAIGTGTVAPAVTDTALGVETHRVAGTGTLVTTTVTNDTAQLVSIFSGFTGTEAVTEVGMFNAATVGGMLMRQTFAALNVNWDLGDSIEMTVKIAVS